jgi:CDP-diacylglycerol pyrophosphatase
VSLSATQRFGRFRGKNGSRATIANRRYWARRLDSADLADAAPFRLLADGLEGAKDHMGLETLIAVGATFAGRPGFVLLADHAELAAGGHGEDLQDHDCKVATAAR